MPAKLAVSLAPNTLRLAAWIGPTLLLALAACSDDGQIGDEAGSTTDPGGSSDTGVGTSEGTEAGTTDAGTTEAGMEETGDPPGRCGDGVVDPGEACDDGNADEADGCTSSCEIGPCGFEWIVREPAVMTSAAGHVPAVLGVDPLGEPELIMAHQVGAGPLPVNITRASLADGALLSKVELSPVTADEELPNSLAQDPGSGDLFIGIANRDLNEVRVRRVGADGQQLWATSRSGADPLSVAIGLGGELVYAATTQLSSEDSDAVIVGLDPTDGSELWSQTYSGPTAANGYSLDAGLALTIDEQGTMFMGVRHYVAWDTLTPVVVAYGPGGGEPLWTTELLDVPGRQLYLRHLALGPDGLLVAAVQRFDGSGLFWLVGIQRETGTVEWVVERGDFDIPTIGTYLGGLAVSQDRVMVTGWWLDEIPGNFNLVAAFALGLNLDGTFACQGTHDDYDAETESFESSWQPWDLVAGPDGAFYMSGQVGPYFVDDPFKWPLDLLRARVR